MNNSLLFRHIACVLILYMSSIVAFAQDGKIRIIEEKDTSTVHSLNEVIVTTSTSTKETRATAPLQILSGEALEGLNAIQVADAVKHFSGVMVKDYGGIGGLKTVSVRGLGACQSAV